MSDVLPDGRVDHRNHARDTDWSGWWFACLDCSTEECEVPWRVPYDLTGRPFPTDWRTLPAAEVRALCGMPPDCTDPTATAAGDEGGE